MLNFSGTTRQNEFVDFWLLNRVHADDPCAVRRGRLGVEALVETLIQAAQDQGFSKTETEAKLGGDIYANIRSRSIPRNSDEKARLRRDK
jgi:hypothetical protein